MDKPASYIEVTDTWSQRIRAHAVDIHLEILGENFFWGNAAYEKSKEVSELVTGLKGCGIPLDDILISDVLIRSETGLISKSTKAVYKLKINVKQLDKMGEILGVVSSQKQVKLGRLHWLYDFDAVRCAGLATVSGMVMNKAKIVAEALGQRINCIKTFSESVNYAQERAPELDRTALLSMADPGTRRMAQPITLGEGTSIMQEMEMTLRVKLEVFVTQIEH